MATKKSTKKKKKELSWDQIGAAIGRKVEKELKEHPERVDSFKMRCHVRDRGPESAVYGMGLIGSFVYYITTATTAWGIVVGIFKSIFWPAFLVYGALKTLGI